MKYTLALIALYFFGLNTACSQDYSRDIIVTTDTVREFNNTRKYGDVTDAFNRDGIEKNVFETPFKVTRISSKKMNNLNGILLEFYLGSNMPKVKGNYQNNEKNGAWYYWKESGVLSRKEIWKMGKLITSEKYE